LGRGWKEKRTRRGGLDSMRERGKERRKRRKKEGGEEKERWMDDERGLRPPPAICKSLRRHCRM